MVQVASIDLITMSLTERGADRLVGGLGEVPVVGLHLLSFLSGWAVFRPQKL